MRVIRERLERTNEELKIECANVNERMASAEARILAEDEKRQKVQEKLANFDLTVIAEKTVRDKCDKLIVENKEMKKKWDEMQKEVTRLTYIENEKNMFPSSSSSNITTTNDNNNKSASTSTTVTVVAVDDKTTQTERQEIDDKTTQTDQRLLAIEEEERSNNNSKNELENDDDDDDDDDVRQNPFYKEMVEKKNKEIQNLQDMMKEADDAIQSVEIYAKEFEQKCALSEAEKKHLSEDLEQLKREYDVLAKFTRDRGVSAVIAFSNMQREYEKLDRQLREYKVLEQHYYSIYHSKGENNNNNDDDDSNAKMLIESKLKEYQERAMIAEDQLFSATVEAENEEQKAVENLKSSERERQVSEDRLLTEKQRCADLRKDLNEFAIKIVDFETKLRDARDQIVDKQKIIDGLKKDIEVQDEILIGKEELLEQKQIEFEEKLVKEALIAKEIVDDAVQRCTEAEEKLDVAEIRLKELSL